jgi:hypothetical protein
VRQFDHCREIMRALRILKGQVCPEATTLDSEPLTLNPEILHPTYEWKITLNLESYTLNPKPQTSNPKPQTLNPTPSILRLPKSQTLYPEFHI